MIKKILLLLSIALISCQLKADEGMWPLPELGKLYPKMHALGLQLPASAIYHPDSISLKDAVVFFGSGCTGEVISPNGLVLTNHHCGLAQIQSHSTLENDYLVDGFWATSQIEELPCPGLKVTFIEKIEEVTDYVFKALTEEKELGVADFLLPAYLNELALRRAEEEKLPDHEWMQYEIKPFYGGNQYYMFTKKVYSDVRLVGAPPSSIGKFGVDTDNWMWPRHAGDFALFRVYSDPEGQPTSYHEQNVPLQPKRWLSLSSKGIHEHDFVMMLGFPGRTHQYYTSWEVAERRDMDNAIRIHFRNLRQEIMLEEMLNDPLVRIQYASKYASSANAYKNAIGTNWAINRQDIEQSKRERQERLIEWAKRTNQMEYIDALDTICQIVEDRSALRKKSWLLDEAIIRGIEFASIPDLTEAISDALRSKDKIEIDRQLERLEKVYAIYANPNFNPKVEQKITKVLLNEYMSWLPEHDWPDFLSQMNQKYKGDIDRFVDDLFNQSIFSSRHHLDQFLSNPNAKKIQKDPIFGFAASIQQEKQTLTESLKSYDAAYAIAHRSFVKGLMEAEENQLNFPDANLTMRLTYGQVKGYTPSDAKRYHYQTTLDGVMEKEDSTNWEFIVPYRLKELYQQKDFGAYALPNQQMPVCFCANTHSTGGNSGSPLLNAQGELVGINFDRNWEGVGGDIQYLPDYQRSIIVDIRYVLFIIDRFAQATYLLDELDIRP